MNIKIKIFDGGKMPIKTTKGAVCFDCFARLANDFIKIPAGSRCKIALGFAVELPDNYEIVIRGRSGLSSTEYVDVIEGTIDSDYRGEILAIIANNGKGDFSIKNGDRICQIAVREVPEINFIETDSLSSTERGNKGFGSTGA